MQFYPPRCCWISRRIEPSIVGRRNPQNVVKSFRRTSNMSWGFSLILVVSTKKGMWSTRLRSVGYFRKSIVKNSIKKTIGIFEPFGNVGIRLWASEWMLRRFKASSCARAKGRQRNFHISLKNVPYVHFSMLVCSEADSVGSFLLPYSRAFWIFYWIANSQLKCRLQMWSCVCLIWLMGVMQKQFCEENLGR